MNRTALTPISDNPIILMLQDCRDWGMLHDRIRKAFGFPTYYGENWDAMWDCLRDVFFPSVQREIIVEGLDSMSAELQKYSCTLRDIFHDLQEIYPWVTVTYRQA